MKEPIGFNQTDLRREEIIIKGIAKGLELMGAKVEIVTSTSIKVTISRKSELYSEVYIARLREAVEGYGIKITSIVFEE